MNMAANPPRPNPVTPMNPTQPGFNPGPNPSLGTFNPTIGGVASGPSGYTNFGAASGAAVGAMHLGQQLQQNNQVVGSYGQWGNNPTNLNNQYGPTPQQGTYQPGT